MLLDRLTSMFRTAQDDDRRRRALLFDFLRPGDIFIDCGANIGQETLPALDRGAIVYAFEPHPAAFATLRGRVGQNADAHLLQKGVWTTDGTLNLYLHERHAQDALVWSTGASLVSDKANVDPKHSVAVEVVDLAGFIARLGQPVRALKIDVEGAEFDLLEHLIDRGTYRLVDSILVESHARKMPKLRTKEAAIKARIVELGITNISLDWV